MKSIVCKPKTKDLKTMLKDKEAAIDTNEKKIVKLSATMRFDPM